MQLRQGHFNVLGTLRVFGGVATVDMIRDALLRQVNAPNAPASFCSKQRVYALLDQLQTIKMIDATWATQGGGPAVFALTKRGLECLEQTHH